MPRAKTISQGREFFDSIHLIVSEKGFDREEVISIIEAGLIAAYRKKYKTTDNVRVVIDEEEKDVYIMVSRNVVEDVVLAGMQISLEEAQQLKPDAELGQYVEVVERPLEYGRIAAQTAIQVVSQRLRTLEQNKIQEEYNEKIGELMNGYILRKRGETVYVDLGKVEAIMPRKHQISTEKYRVEDKIKVLLHSIDMETKGRGGLKVLVSRSDQRFVAKLFEMEVPEIYDRIVEIKSIGRIAGVRSKVVVHSGRGDVDPVGACVGVRGVRIQAIVRELGNERVDIVEYSDVPREFISNALSPATPTMVKLDMIDKKALTVVADKDLSIAIGKEGSNVRLASEITGFHIDVKSESQFNQEMTSPEARSRLDDLFSAQPEAVESEDEQEEEGTLLEELPGLTGRIINLLRDGGIHHIEDLVSMEESDLIALEGIGSSTAKRIMEIIAENVEFEEEEEEEGSDDEGVENEDDKALLDGEST